MIYLKIRQSNTVKLIMSSKAIAFAPFDGNASRRGVDYHKLSNIINVARWDPTILDYFKLDLPVITGS